MRKTSAINDCDLTEITDDSHGALTHDDLNEIHDFLSGYELPPVNEKKVDEAINALIVRMKYHKKKRSAAARVFDPFCWMGHIASYTVKWQVIFCLILYIIAYKFVTGENTNPYTPAIVLSPVPFLLGILDFFRGRSAGMAELEMSFKFNYKQLMTAKFLFAGVLNILCNVALSVFIVQKHTEVDFVRITLLWCMPFFLISGISLLIAVKVRNDYSSMACLGIWSGLSVFAAGRHDWMEFLTEHAAVEAYAVIATISFFLMIFVIILILTEFIERGDFFDSYVEKHIKTI